MKRKLPLDAEFEHANIVSADAVEGVDASVLAELFRKAARLIVDSDALIIAAGAGMGVDSGLPDFRSPQGFWAAYPALGSARLQFSDIANLASFARDPRLAWGFYGHRLKLYRQTQPHVGFALLRMIGARAKHGAFVFTSNVDGAFQKSGFAASRVVECHGSIHYLQCVDNCVNCIDEIWSAKDFVPEVDAEKCRLVSKLPTCPGCGALARPNILMFSDWGWISARAHAQQARLSEWLDDVERPTVIEIGAGYTIPTVRHFAESLRVPVIRINPEARSGFDAAILNIPTSGLVGIQGITRVLLEEIWEGEDIEI